MNECVFCKIVAGEIPSEKIKETAEFVVFKDIKPSAPVHYLIVPKKHLKDISEADSSLWGKVREIALEIAKEGNFSGFRLSTNAGDAAMVSHMHIHFMAGITKDREL